jgi:L-alanine-DL-glutamate epimerase-like enolase superfamily enzyme
MPATILSIRARSVEVPLDLPVAISGRSITARHYTLVRVETTDGHHGIGFCYGGNYGGSLGAAAVRDLFAPLLLGADPSAFERNWGTMYSNSLLHGRAGIVMRALSAIDVALWDRNAQTAGLPLWKLLGGASDGHVPAYASGGYFSPGKTPADLGREVRGYVDAGFDAVKIKVGAVPLAEDEARVAAAREAIGRGVRLMLDANNAWNDVPTAIEAIRRFEAYDPFWIEEPFQPDDVESHAALARAVRTPVATGEIAAGRRQFEALLSHGAASILQTDAAVCGGITEFLRIAHNAAAHGVKIWPHWFHDLHAHLVAALPNGGMVEFFPDSSVLNFRRLLDRQLVATGGRLELPTAPGLGFAFDEAAVDAFAVDDWA